MPERGAAAAACATAVGRPTAAVGRPTNPAAFAGSSPARDHV